MTATTRATGTASDTAAVRQASAASMSERPAAGSAHLSRSVLALTGAVALLAWAVVVAIRGGDSDLTMGYVTAMVLTCGAAPLAAAWPNTATAVRGPVQPMLALTTLIATGTLLVGADALARVLGAPGSALTLRLLALQLPFVALAAAGTRRLAAVAPIRAVVPILLYTAGTIAAAVVFLPGDNAVLLALSTVGSAVVAAVAALPGMRHAARERSQHAPIRQWAFFTHLLVGAQALMLANLFGGGGTATTYLIVLGCWSLAGALVTLRQAAPAVLGRRALVAGGVLIAIGPALEAALGSYAAGLANGLVWLAPGLFALVLADALAQPVHDAGRGPAADLARLVTWASVVAVTMVVVGVVPRGNTEAVVRGLATGATAGLFIGLGLTYLAVRQLAGSSVLDRLSATSGYAALIVTIAAIGARILTQALVGEEAVRIAGAAVAGASVVLVISWIGLRFTSRFEREQ